MASNLAMHLSALKSEPASGLGITTVLRDHLRRGKTFRPPRPRAGKRVTKKRGLQIGAWVDRLFSKVIEKKAKLNPGDHRHRRCMQLFTGLHRRGIKCLRTQFRVAAPDLGIWTSLDALGIQGDAAVVIELKCTQYTLEQHEELYEKHCVHRRMLANGLLNTEKNAHALQTGFGMLGLRRVLPRVPIKGLVVVCASDGAKMYDVDERFVESKLFSVAAVRPACGAYVKNVSFQPAPSSPKAIECVREALAKNGCPFAVKDIRQSFGNTYGSFTVAASSRAYLVVALVYTKGVKETVGDKKKRQLATDTEKLWLDKKKKVKVRGCLVHFSSGSSPIHRVEFLPRTFLPEK